VDRFRLYQVLQKENVNSKVLSYWYKENLNDKEKKALILSQIDKIKYPVMSPDNVTVAMNIDDMVASIIKLSTRKHSQRPLKINSPSPTVLTLPDDFIHPTSPRVMSVRELARIQSFPDMFIFKSKETTGSVRRKFEVPQYSQVGNAVAPLLAYELGKKFIELL